MTNKMNPQGKRIIRFAPCPEYDVECMESWLEDMARQGSFLKGNFYGLYFFEQNQPAEVRYRLQAAAKSISIFDDHGGDPDPEMRQLSQEFGWEYVTSGRDFYVFCSKDRQIRELNTDAAVQAMTIDLVRRRQNTSAVTLLFILILNIILQRNFFMKSIGLGSSNYFPLIFLLLWTSLDQVVKTLHLRKLRLSLLRGEDFTHNQDWQKRAKRFHLKNFVFLSIAVIVVFGFGHAWYQDSSGAYKNDMTTYTEPLPIATLQDLLPSAEFSYDDFGVGNTIEVKQDWLAPQIISFFQTGTLRKDGELLFKGGLVVDYYETKTPWLAKKLADELHHTARREARSYEDLPAPQLDVDSVVAFRGLFPTIIMVKGNQVVKVELYQSIEKNQWTMQEWAEVFANSLK